jgi:acyl-CoA-binding protein
MKTISNKNSLLEYYHLYSRASPDDNNGPIMGLYLAGTWEKTNAQTEKAGNMGPSLC